ncbi:MAG: hypothetical protein NXI10_11270 [bacterium]|nr:hypothetical protein [bacterium]
MKTLLTAGLLLFSAVAFCQQTGTEITPTQAPSKMHAEYRGATHTEVKQSQSVTISKRPGQPQQTHDAAYYNQEIAKVDAHISAIDAKIAHVNSIPSEKALAEQNGWFQQMDQIKLELNQKRATLIQKRDNL